VNKIADVASMIVVVAGIMVLVRRGSQGPALVTAMTNGFASVLGAATGGGSF
jgi:hypothetical protein